MNKTRPWIRMGRVFYDRVCGTIKKFDNESRWCFIEGDDELGYLGGDYHKKCGEMEEGMRVSFITMPNSPLGPAALGLTKV